MVVLQAQANRISDLPELAGRLGLAETVFMTRKRQALALGLLLAAAAVRARDLARSLDIRSASQLGPWRQAGSKH